VPFTVTIPEAERDKDLIDKQRVEWPGILQWAVEGCLEWQKAGLAPPKAVVAATDKYLASEDVIANWLDDKCEQNPNFTQRRSALYESWKYYAERTGEFAGPAKEFYAALESRGFEQTKHAGVRKFGGLRLLPEPGLRATTGGKVQ
jgi:putative DNA primase/helicase